MNTDKIVSVEVEEEDTSTNISVTDGFSTEEESTETTEEASSEEESETEESSETQEETGEEESHEEESTETDDEHQEQQEETEDDDEPVYEINDDQAFSWMRERYGISEDVSSDEIHLMLNPEDLPEDVEAFAKFKRETGGSLSDFMKTQRDFDSVSEDELIFDFIKSQNPTFDDDDIRWQIRTDLEIDEDEDITDDQIRRKKLRKKEIYGKALDHFKSEQEKFKTSIDQRGTEMSEEDRNLFAKFKEDRQSEPERIEAENRRRDHFANETERVFSDDFDGFEFKLSDDLTAKFKIDNVDSVKNNQMSAMNFISSHLDENRMLKDANEYHKQMYSATHINEIVKWAFEQGKTSGLEDQEKDSKNINMDHRKKPEVVSKGGITVEVEDTDNTEGGLRIKKRST